MSKKRFVVVCTEKRGVFGGFVENSCCPRSIPTTDPIVMTDAQMCVYWSANVKGVVGLAATGPDVDSRITKPVPVAQLHGITAVFDATNEAVAAWQSCPWG